MACVIGLPLGATTHHLAPKLLKPCPFVCPGLLSLAKKYSGRPPYFTWRTPPPRLNVPSWLALTFPDAWGEPFVTNGGQTVAHAPLQLDVPPWSALNMYRVRPEASVR